MGETGALPDELHREILRWVPVKSLMRFKCVSSTWNSTIVDPSFVEAYRGGHRGFLLRRHKWSPAKSEALFTFFKLEYYDDGCGPTTSTTTTTTVNCQVSEYSLTNLAGDTDNQISKKYETNVANGLTCFCSETRLWLYNIATRESLELPASGFRVLWLYRTRKYYLGFDPEAQLYKLFFFAVDSDDCKCKILTIGLDSNWRDIDPPPLHLGTHGEYSEGVVYWWGRDDKHDVMVTFDFVLEKFRTIPLPDRNVTYSTLGFGPMAAMYRDGTKELILRYKTSERGTEGSWISAGILYDMVFDNVDTGVFPRGMFPNGKVLLYSVSPSLNSFILVDPIQEETQQIVIENPSLASPIIGDVNTQGMGLPSSVFKTYDYCEENVISLRRYFNSRMHK